MDTTPTPLIALALEDALRKLDSTVKDESARRLKVQILLLQNDNESLRSQLGNAATLNARQEQDLQQVEQKRLLLAQSHENFKSTIHDLKTQLVAEQRASRHATETLSSTSKTESSLRRQLEDLQASLVSQNREASKAQKDVQKEIKTQQAQAHESATSLELLRLQLQSAETELRTYHELSGHGQRTSRQTEGRTEVDELKTIVEVKEQELRHFKSNLLETEGSLKGLREKLAATKAQLEESRSALAQERCNTKNASKSTSQDTNIINRLELLQTKLESTQEELKHCQNELADELRKGDQARKETQKAFRAAKSREAELESKNDLLKAKLDSMKEQLSESRAETVHMRQAITVKGTQATKEHRKRHAREMSVDNSIGTPDGVAIRGKKISMRDRLEQTTIGEKSMFSITPYLNRTANIPLDSPSSEPGVKTGDPIVKEANKDESPVTVPDRSAPDQAGQDVLMETRIGVQNRRSTQKVPKRKPKAISTLGDVVEETNENDGPENGGEYQLHRQTTHKIEPATTTNSGDASDLKKTKKRKLLGGGKTLFDEEDGDGGKRIASKVTLAPARALGRGLGVKSSLKPGAGSASAFGGFSPLKKDRRGVNASFLG